MFSPFLNQPTWVKYLVKTWRKYAMVGSFAFTSYKAFDYRQLWIKEDIKNDKLTIENQSFREVQNEVLFKLSGDNYTIDDIALPMWYKIYDAEVDEFRMVRINKAYREAYNVNGVEYFTKTDQEVIGSDLGDQYQANDRIAFNGDEKAVHVFYEHYVREDGKYGVGKYAKWKVVKDDNVYIYGLELERVELEE